MVDGRIQDGRTLNHLRERIESQLRPLVSDHDDREDITQDCLLRVWLKSRTFRGQSKFTSWLHTVVRNEFVSWTRRRRARGRLATERGDWMAPQRPRDPCDEILTRVTMQRMLSGMSPADRRICELRYLEDKTSAEVGSHVGLAAASVRCRTFRLVSRVRRRYPEGFASGGPG